MFYQAFWIKHHLLSQFLRIQSITKAAEDIYSQVYAVWMWRGADISYAEMLREFGLLSLEKRKHFPVPNGAQER